MRAFILRLFVFVLPLVVCAMPALGQSAPHEPTTYFWGIHRGCVRDGYLSAAVENRLRLTTNRLITVGNELVAKSPGCLGEECLRSWKSLCTNRQGVLLGGVVIPRQVSLSGRESVTWHLIRLWRVETATGQARSLQHACRKCDLPTLLPLLASELLENPPSSFQTAQEVRSARPPFCASVETTQETPLPGEPRIAVVVSGEARSARTLLLRALKTHLSQAGREVVRVVEHGNPKAPDLAPLIGKKVPNDVLGVELLPEGQVRLRLLLAKTLATSDNTDDCLGCSDAALAHRVVVATGLLLDRCSGATSCAPDVIATPLPWPSGVCAPSSEPTCPPPEPEEPPTSGPPPIQTQCGPLAEAPADPPVQHDDNGHKKPDIPTPRLSTGRIVGASLLGTGAIAALVTAGILTSLSGQPTGATGCPLDDFQFLRGDCVHPNLASSYGPAYAMGALLAGGAVLTLWPLFKAPPPQQTLVSR